MEALLLFLAIGIVLLWIISQGISSDHEFLAVFIEIAQSILTQINQIVPVLFVLAELVGHVNNKRSREQSENHRPKIKHIIADLERVNWEEAVAGVVTINKVIGEQPEFKAEVVEDAPEDQTKDCCDNEEYQQIETDVPDSLLEPEGPKSEAHQHEDG